MRRWLRGVRARWAIARELVRAESGQAAVEYGLITWLLLGGMVLGGYPMWIALLRAIQVYFDSFYLVLRLPIP